MNNDASNVGGVPLALRVTDPVLWLEHNDRDPELRETIDHLVQFNRIAEAVLCLESYIGRTALVRSQVNGWDGGWAMAVTQLVAERSLNSIRLVQSYLRSQTSFPREKKG
jgi:hypothetical protein